ncbi:hypothetical protein KL905_002321 [Ogataea polymorpha]|uniref:uncharacterized protein n=1 Tax=Ogataea polymorpha TaxID=460523 RepID=UPI0007F4B61A|nr:uncharacterized protein OGAPODRAFT_17176 [Ogataea polymorpha]KAG7922299.1 hypothetical protein KL905_002321 [Ogataea polymorpha]KAG7936492.1 hypothetical protein KL934_001959 [Ogataea polymorpha]OBA14353.1 hypothetical protein OGAPODRAFT_17176 [Ogataea polymorpha]
MASELDNPVPEPGPGYRKPLFKSFTSDRNLKRFSISGPALRVDTSFSEAAAPADSSAGSRRNSVLATPLAAGHMLENEAKRSSVQLEIADMTLVVPTFVHKCCQFILSQGPKEGIFRINGSIKKIKKIEALIREQGIDSFEFDTCRVENVDNSEDTAPNAYDAAMVLKRWLSNLADGLITLDVSKSLKTAAASPQEVPVLDETEDAARTAEEASQTESEDAFSLSSYKTIPTSVEDTDKEKESLENLPLVNLHLFIYLLSFLNKLSQPDVCDITKMPSSNLAKIFQMSFFKVDDLQPQLASAASTDDLLQNYKANERLLQNWITSYDQLAAKLRSFVADNQEKLKETLASPLVEEPLAMPKLRNRSVTEDKQQKRRSLFGYRSLSNALSSRTLSQVLTGSPDDTGKRSVSDSAVEKYPNTQDLAVDRKLRRRSLGWFANSNLSTPSLSRKQGETLTPVTVSGPLSLSADDLLQTTSEATEQPVASSSSEATLEVSKSNSHHYELSESKEVVPEVSAVPRTEVPVDTLDSLNVKPSKKNNRLSKMFSVRFGLSKMIH